tara:strand:+ start:11823 stop:12269 length:447 start_codon:yes stop_codon:yes gene_type:complete
MSLVKIEASFDPSNPAHLAAAMNFLSAVGGNVIPSGTAAPAETTTADAPKEEAPKKRAPRKKKVAEVVEQSETTTADAPKEVATGPGNTTEEKSETTITLEDIRTLTSKKAKDHREAIKAKLTEWSVPNVVKIPTEKYAEFIDFLNSL